MMTRDGRLPDPATLDRLMAALRHRGPDAEGQHVAGDVALVHTRLSIVDLQTGDQPLFGERGLALVANAEIYNDPALRAAMPEVAFRTRSDCEPVLSLYAAHGLGFARHLRGMYALALHDPARRRGWCWRATRSASSRSTTSKPLGASPSPPSRRHCCARGWRGPRSTPAAAPSCCSSSSRPARRPSSPAFFACSPARRWPSRAAGSWRASGSTRWTRRPRAATLDAVLTESVAAHLRSDVPYGLFLSGGIDSAALLWLMHRATGERVQAITIGYDGSDASDESEGALAVARAVGARCERIAMTEADFWNFAPRVAAALDDPTTDAAALPTWLLGRAAGGQLKVTLCGEGGDEMFAGYGRYRRAVAPWRFVQRPPRTGGVFQDVAGLALDGWRVGLGAAERQAAVGRGRLAAMQALDCAEWLPNDLLVKLDRCLMAHGVEGRTPFVDPLVAAFALALPDRCKVDWRRGKLVLRRWLAERLPQAEPFAKKRGFKPPIGRWMAARGEALARLVAGAPGIAAFAAPEAVGRVFARGEAQARWSLLFYALWHAHHVLGVDAGASVADVLAAAGRRG